MIGEIRIGLIGVGSMGRNHLRVLSMMRGVEVAFVYDCDGAHARFAAAPYGVPVADNLGTAVDAVDALVICAPTSTHAEYLEEFAPRVRALFVEKPLAHSAAAARRIEQLVRESGTLIQVGFIERYNPAVIALRQVLEDTDDVISIDFTRTNRLSARITDVDVITDLMIHDIDLALMLNGPVAGIAAQGMHRDGLVEFASAQLVHENGSFSRLQASRITERKTRQIDATCGDRFVECDLLRKEILIHRQSVIRDEGMSFYSVSSQQEAVTVGLQEALLTELQAFLALVKGEAPSDVPDFDQGLATLELAEAVGAQILKDAA